MSRYDSADDLLADVAEAQGGLSPNFRKIADYIVDNPDEIAMLSTRELASVIAVDPSSIVRFAQQFDFSGHSELKSLFQSRLRHSRHRYLERAQTLQKRGSDREIASILHELHRTNTTNLKDVFELNDPEKLEQAAHLIMAAGTAYVCGFRNCFPAAFALHYVSRMFLDNIVLSHGIGGTVADAMRCVEKGDVLVAIGMEPYTRATVSAVRFAKHRGAAVIALTDDTRSPLARNADIALVFPRHGLPVLGSIVPVIALSEALTTVMISKGGVARLENLRNSVQQLTDFSVYANEHPAG